MIEIEALHLRAGGFDLEVEGLSLAPGEFLVILGPTGSGKTVLLETLAGLRRPERGSVRFGGRDVTLEPPERRRVGFVYQDYALFPHLDVRRNIEFGLRRRFAVAEERGRRARAGGRGSPPAEVERLAGLLGISSLLDRYPESLSGGEKQRVALARALAIKPEVLLLDEPLSALDRQTREGLRGLLKKLHKESGTTVLHVTHDLDEALALADRLVILMDGRVRQVGIPEEVLLRPVDAEIARLLGLPNVLPVESIAPTGAGTLDVRLAPQGPTLTVGTAVEGDLVCPHAVIRAEEVRLFGADGAIPEGIAPQDLLEGTVVEIRVQSAYCRVEVEVPPNIVVHVMRPELERSGVRPGGLVRLHVPPQAVHVCPGGPIR